VDKPMRWAQLTLVEDDPGKFDPQFWLDYFKRTRSDAVCLSAGGCVAYYPTKVPFHHRSQWLGDSDPFGTLVTGCRKLGMIVIARTDPHATYGDVQARIRIGSRLMPPANAPLGLSRCGSPARSALQLRVHISQRRDRVIWWTDLHQPGRFRHVLANAAKIFAKPPITARTVCRTHRRPVLAAGTV
jgi:hypothetical protein